MPNAVRRASVAWAMRPKPRKPTVRVGVNVVVLSWGPVKKNGAKLKLGHWVGGGQALANGSGCGGKLAYLSFFDQGDAFACVAASHESKHYGYIRHLEGEGLMWCSTGIA